MEEESLKKFKLLNDEEALNARGGDWCVIDSFLGCSVEMVLCSTIEVSCSSEFTWNGDCYESSCPNIFSTCTQPD